MKNEILKFIKKYNSPVKLKKIYKYFRNISHTEIDRILDILLDEGAILKISKRKFIATKQRNFIIGKLTVYREGFGFVDPLEGGKGIYIPPKHIRYALNGDIVSCYSFRKRGKIEGRIERIIERGINKIVGKIVKHHKIFYIKPADNKIKIEFKLDIKDKFKVKDGDYVVAQLNFEPSPYKMPSVKIIENLGKEGPHLDIELIIRKYGLITEFPEYVKKELCQISDTIPEEEIRHRIDLRDQLCFTIDGEDAKDFDDAVAIHKLPNNKYRLFVHIADVSYYVKLNSALDRIAYQKATSVYFPDRCIPMLPEKLSNELCSLNPYEDRLTVTCEMVINHQGNVENFKIYESIINSKARLTYKIVQQILEGVKEAKEKFPYVVNALIEMKELTEILINKREKRGSIDFDLPEPELILDESGRPVEIVKSERLLSHRLIEEFMIAANETIATFMYNSGYPSIYRVHDPPNPEKVRDFIRFLRLIGIDIDGRKVTPKLFQKIIRKIEGRPEESLINYLMLRTMAIAKYSSKNIGHFGLASNCYTHFTSPIRRYADLTLHRLLKLVLYKKYRAKNIKYWETRLDEICKNITDKSIKADEAEREVIELKQMQFISREIGNIFEGIITNISERELYIELIDTLVKGFVPLSEINDDYYVVDTKKYRIVGKRTGKIFRMGDRIIVRLIDVDFHNKRAKFKLIRKVKNIEHFENFPSATETQRAQRNKLV